MYSPPAVVVPIRSARGSFRARSAGVCQPVSCPLDTMPWKVVVVGAPDASLPPMTYGMPPRLMNAASDRGSGRAGPSAHVVRLPLNTVEVRTLAVVPDGVRPPMRYMFSPLVYTPAPARPPPGRASCSGLC